MVESKFHLCPQSIVLAYSSLVPVKEVPVQMVVREVPLTLWSMKITLIY